MSKDQALNNWLWHKPDGVTLHSGARSNWLIDAKALFDYEPLRNNVLAFWFLNLQLRPYPTFIVSVPTGGDPWAKAIASKLGVNWCTMDELQSYKGDVGENIYIVDDVCTSGGSLGDAERAVIVRTGNWAMGTLVVINRGHYRDGILPWATMHFIDDEGT